MKTITVSVPVITSSDVNRATRTAILSAASGLLWLNRKLAPKPAAPACDHSYEEFNGRRLCSHCCALHPDHSL